MNFITESELRELWQNGRGKIPVFPENTHFSAAALDFLKTQHIEVQYNPTSPAGPNPPPPTEHPGAWDKPGSFPVILGGPLPACSECGQPIHTKPEHMTQLDASHFAPKTAPRLVFRGRVDSLHALVMLTSSTARRFELPELAQQLDTLAAYCREIMSAEYHQRPVAGLIMLGKDEQQLHDISHWPDRYLGIQHLVPAPHDHEILHWLNMLRTQSREVEISALQAFPSDEQRLDETRVSLARALNRLSSAIYVLELYFQAGQLSWKVNG